MMVFSLVSMAAIASALHSARMSHHRLDSQTAFELAEAGLQHAAAKLDKDITYTGQGATSFGAGTFSTTVTTPADKPLHREVVSVGRVRSNNGRYLERRVATLLRPFVPHIVWKYAIIAKENITLVDRSVIDSSPLTNQGHVHSNGTLTMGKVRVNGRVSAVGTISQTGNPQVSGGIQAGAAPVEFPSIDKPGYMAAAARNGVTYGNVTADSGTLTLKGKIVGNLVLTGSAVAYVQGPVWVTGSVTVTARTWSGNGVLIAEGKASITSSSSTSSTGVDDLAVVTFSTADDAVIIQAKDNSDPVNVLGGVFAPDGGVHILGLASVRGGVVARKVTLDGKGAGTDVIRNTLYRPQIGVLPMTEYWEER